MTARKFDVTVPAYWGALNLLPSLDEYRGVGSAQHRRDPVAGGRPPVRSTFWGTLGTLARQPWGFRLGLLAIVVAGAVVAVVIGDRYGSTWGSVVGIVVVPLAAVSFVRRRGSE